MRACAHMRSHVDGLSVCLFLPGPTTPRKRMNSFMVLGPWKEKTLWTHTSSAAEGVVEDLLAGVAVQRKRRPRPPCPEPTHRCRSASQRVCVVLGQDVDQAASTLRLYACGRKVNVVDVCPSFLFPLLLFVSVGGVREKK